MIFYDFEVTKYDWLTVLIDPSKDDPYVVINDADKMNAIYQIYCNDVWIGFNSRHYDQYILKSILCGLNPWKCNEHIIDRGKPGWSFSSLLKKIFLINYDCMPLGASLKQLEGFQGHNIHESSVPFNIDRKMTQDEINETVKYCHNDVLECMNVFAANIDDFKSIQWLVKEYHFPYSYVSKTKAQLSADILECRPVKRTDEWDIFTLDCLKIAKYSCVKDWFLNDKNHDYAKEMRTTVAGVEHIFAWGGLHGARKKYHHKCKNTELILHIDVVSYYPRLMIFHNLLTRNAKRPERFKEIYDRRLALKREGKKKEQAPLKIVINGTYGICKDKTNNAYDPRNANLICINGQLLLLDLIEKLETIPSFELIQSNTDGLIIKINAKDFDLMDDICYEWEQRCNMELDFEYVDEIFQKDVNNYLFHYSNCDTNGSKKNKYERKGMYVKELSPMDNDLPIINEALVAYMSDGITIEHTINSCHELIKFQKISKLTNKFDHIVHNGIIYRNKCYRCFASNRPSDGPVYKVKLPNQLFKLQNTSEHCFIENGDITNVRTPDYLDKNWYINLAKERLNQYGVIV